MYSGENILAEAKSSLAGMGSMKKEAWYFDYESIPGFFYQCFSFKSFDRDYVIGSKPPGFLKKIIGYVVDTKLKRNLYKSLRTKAMSNVGSRSILVNEIVGAYGLAKSLIEYSTITIKMYLDR